MALTQKQAAYARLVASGMDFHTAALEAGCKNHEAARKFVKDMARRENVQAHIKKLQTVNAELSRPTANTASDISYPSAQTEQAHAHPAPSVFESPLEFLTSVFNNVDGLYTPKERINAAIALLPYTEQKLAQTGKKEDAADNARAKSESGRFATFSNQLEMPIGGLKN